jgi:hypothetical protein
MKALIAFGLFLLTAFLFGAGFYLSINDKGAWGYFLGAGVFAFLISAAVSAGLVKEEEEEKKEPTEMGDN